MSNQAFKKDLCQYDEFAADSEVFDRLVAMSGVADCCLVSCDGVQYPVHKAKLLEQSKVLRDLLQDLTSTAELPLHEDAATVRLLITGMYNANSPVAWLTIEPLLELARKYIVPDIQLNCERFLNAEALTVFNLPRYMLVACQFDIKPAIQRCQDYIAGTVSSMKNGTTTSVQNFKRIASLHGEDWSKHLPGHVVTDMMVRQLKVSCPSMYTA